MLYGCSAASPLQRCKFRAWSIGVVEGTGPGGVVCIKAEAQGLCWS